MQTSKHRFKSNRDSFLSKSHFYYEAEVALLPKLNNNSVNFKSELLYDKVDKTELSFIKVKQCQACP
jgi:hypothetical protein